MNCAEPVVGETHEELMKRVKAIFFIDIEEGKHDKFRFVD